MSERRFISIEKAQSLEESILFLSSYTGPYLHGKPWDGKNVIGTSIEDKDIDWEATAKLERLGEINKEREEILKYFENRK